MSDTGMRPLAEIVNELWRRGRKMHAELTVECGICGSTIRVPADPFRPHVWMTFTCLVCGETVYPPIVIRNAETAETIWGELPIGDAAEVAR